jgi:hypothetical protein
VPGNRAHLRDGGLSASPYADLCKWSVDCKDNIKSDTAPSRAADIKAAKRVIEGRWRQRERACRCRMK